MTARQDCARPTQERRTGRGALLLTALAPQVYALAPHYASAALLLLVALAAAGGAP